jgi:pimeloyl-ACP methyl ester carboxylesterase
VTEFRQVRLRTGVTLNVGLSGPADAPPVILLHGFPESHRTWRGLEPLLRDRFRLIMPDQRGYAGSDKPKGKANYKTDKLVDDVFALADALGVEAFSLVGHDWGGAVAWASALRHDPRVERLAIINSPHPAIFARTLVESAEQRAASQYINAFKAPGFERFIRIKGFEWFFEKAFSGHLDPASVPDAEKQQYIAEWSQPGAFAAMLNWYRAARIIVPPPLLTVPVPDWLVKKFPSIGIPTLVIWGMDDKALLPVQLDGLDLLVDDLEIVRLADVGHFAPWQAPEQVARPLAPFLAG